MWLDRIVPLGQDTMPYQIELSFLFSRDFCTRRVFGSIQSRPAAQARLSLGRANELQERLVIDERLPCPVPTDVAEQPMISQVPLRCSRWQVSDGEGQAEFIRQLLQLSFPQPTVAAIRTAEIGRA